MHDDQPHLETFRLSLAENPLPSRRRQGASAKTIQGYVQDVSIFLRWWQGTFGDDLTVEIAPGGSVPSEPQGAPGFSRLAPDHPGLFGQHGAALCGQSASFLPVPDRYRRHPARSGAGAAVAGQEDPGTEGAGRCPAARFEAAFQTPWVDKVTKRKRTYETQAGLRLIRDKAIAFLMLYAGPRVEEVERLNLEDVELRPKSGVLHIRQGKGFKERDVPLPKPARDPLEAWLKEREKLGVPHKALFVELRAGYRPLSRRSMQNMVAEGRGDGRAWTGSIHRCRSRRISCVTPTPTCCARPG